MKNIHQTKFLSPRSQHGLTLVEMMVALLIGLILMWGIAQVFISNRQTYASVEGAARLQENGQYALNFITRQIRQAGYYPNPYFTPYSTSEHEQTAFGATPALQGIEGGTSTPDGITVAYYTTNSDCVGNGFPLNGSAGGQATTKAAEAAQIAVNAITIGNGAAGRPSLLCNGVEVAEGIENMQIRYGIDTDSDSLVDKYVPFSASLDMTTVLTVRVALLVSTVQEISTNKDTKPYDLLGTSIGPLNDGRMHRIYTTTIKLQDRCTHIPVTLGSSPCA